MARIIKNGLIKVPTQPKDFDLTATGLVFRSYDNQPALEFNIEKQDGAPADLLGATLRLLMYVYDEADGTVTKEPVPFITKNLITESFLNGHVKYILPEALKAYSGVVETYVYIEYPDGSTSDNLGFTFRMKRSAIDGLAQDKADYFIEDFKQLLDGVKQEATDAVNEALAKVEVVSENVSSAQNDLTILEDRIDQANQEIDKVLSGANGFRTDIDTLKINKADKTFVTAQLAQTNTKNQNQLPIIMGGNINYKYVYKTSSLIFVVTQKQHGKGYVRFALRDDIVDSSPTSAGGTGNLLRVTRVDEVSNAFTITQEGNKSGPWGSDGQVSMDGIMIDTIRTVDGGDNASVEYDVDIPVGTYGSNLLYYGSTGSVQNVDVYVDDTKVLAGVSFRADVAGWYTMPIPVTVGKHKIKVVIVTSGYATIAGVNYTELKNYIGQSYDSYYVIHNSSKPYISNQGAIDYAMQSADDNLYYGSYHGGEERTSLDFVLDGTVVNLSDGLKIGKDLEINQKTNIKNGSLMTFSRYIFKFDGTQEFEVIFSGQMNLKRLFTNMTTTHLSFTDVIYPKYVTNLTDGTVYFEDGTNKIVQQNPITKQKITTILNNISIPETQTITPYVQSSQYYHKVYRENILSETETFKGNNFYSAHIFE